jgi:hypothetical protein
MARDRAWIRDGVDAAAFEALATTLAPSRLWSLLLDIVERRAHDRTPATLRHQYARDRFVVPAYIDQRTVHELDGHLLAAASEFEAIELSPVAPLGVCSVLGLASQNKVLAAFRGTEVVSDPTNVMALECARRLRDDASATVRLATSHRCVRAQEVPRRPGFAAHFRIFCLVTAGAERQAHGFTVDAMSEHVMTMLACLDRLEEHGYVFADRQVTLFAVEDKAEIADRIAAGISGAPVTRAVLEHRYYGGLRFQIGARAVDGDNVPLIDGGVFDWVGKLAANSRFVYVASGMGSQLAALRYRTP